MTTKKTAASKAASAKTAAKTPVKRVAKKVAAPIATTPVAATPVAATPVPPAAPAVARGEFETLVRAEAHALAQARGYRDGSPFGDWVRAEAGVRARFAAEGRAVAR